MADDRDLLMRLRLLFAEIDAAHAKAVEAIDTEPDLDKAFAAASELITYVGKLGEVDAELRRRIAGGIWRAENLSLAKLAQRVGVSKSRADQIVNRKPKRAEEDE